MDLVIFIGLQGAGKSTFFRQRFAASHTLVSKDVLRGSRRSQIRNLQARQMQHIEEALAAGRSVVVDNTNPTQADRAPLITLGRQYGATIIGYYFAAPVAESLVRNRERIGPARVPDVAIYATAKRLQPPDYAEGFDQIFVVRIAGEGQFDVSAWLGERGA